ncbi:MAG: hypothetical protein QN229_02025 [Desulfurococcaceae archaeon TW002]
MSFESASIMSRLSDILRKYLKKLAPSAVKMSFYYDIGQEFERRERSFAYYVLDAASRLYRIFSVGEASLYRYYKEFTKDLYRIFSVGETSLYRYYKEFTKDLIDLTSFVEDALSFTSLYMNLLVVFTMLFMVFLAWRP